MSIETKSLSVAAIKNGSVIDHIQAGNALYIIRLLDLAKHGHQVTVGLNLPSGDGSLKDLIKVEGKVNSESEASRISVLAPEGTINIIQNYGVVNKFQVSIPRILENVIVCPNPRCITNHEEMQSLFFSEQRGASIQVVCKYCRQHFDRDEIKEYHT